MNGLNSYMGYRASSVGFKPETNATAWSPIISNPSGTNSRTGSKYRFAKLITTATARKAHHDRNSPNSLHALSRRGFYTRYNLDDLSLIAATLKLAAMKDFR